MNVAAAAVPAKVQTIDVNVPVIVITLPEIEIPVVEVPLRHEPVVIVFVPRVPVTT